jgi:ubiquinone biosynthesis protein UbiJ
MWNWLIKRLAPALWRLQIEARIEVSEAQLADLRDRFTRFQNRENMRKARSDLEGDAALAQDVASLLSRSEPTAGADPATKRLELWKKAH